MIGRNSGKANGLVAVSSARVDGKLAHLLLALAKGFHFLTDELPEAVKFDQALP